MAGIVRRAPDGSMMVIFTNLSKTEGGPESVLVAIAGAAAAADMDRREARMERRLVAVERAIRRREEDNMVVLF